MSYQDCTLCRETPPLIPAWEVDGSRYSDRYKFAHCAVHVASYGVRFDMHGYATYYPDTLRIWTAFGRALDVPVSQLFDLVVALSEAMRHGILQSLYT